MTATDWASYGKVEILLNKFTEAEQAYQQGIQTSTNNGQLYLALADLYSYEGNFGQALKKSIWQIHLRLHRMK